MNIVEQIIIAAANDLLADYCAFVNADTQVDGGEYSGRSEYDVPEGVAAAHNLIQELDYWVGTEASEDGFWTSPEAEYPDGY